MWEKENSGKGGRDHCREDEFEEGHRRESQGAKTFVRTLYKFPSVTY